MGPSNTIMIIDLIVKQYVQGGELRGKRGKRGGATEGWGGGSAYARAEDNL